MLIILFDIIISFLYIVIRTRKNIHILQQNFYNENNRYIKWGRKNVFSVFRLDYLIFIIAIINLIIINNYLLLLLNLFYLVLLYFEYIKYQNEQVKIPLKITSRVKRLIITIVILYLLPIVVYLLTNNVFIFNVLFTMAISFNFHIVFIANVINKPIEKCVFLYYKNKAIKKLKSMNNLEVVGITGSYGKTSSKNILNDILSIKYNSLPTPANFNTQYGLIRTINDNLDKFNDVFIAEMGAFKMGRIKLLCNLVKPKYGIITCIGKAHLETFKSEENIQKGKFELIENLPSDGLGILNMDDPKQVSYKIKNNVKIIWIAIDNKKGPLKACEENADLYLTNNNVNFSTLLSDGLTKVEKNIECGIIITGIGYDNMCEILYDINERNFKYLILSPHTKVDSLIEFLEKSNICTIFLGLLAPTFIGAFFKILFLILLIFILSIFLFL